MFIENSRSSLPYITISWKQGPNVLTGPRETQISRVKCRIENPRSQMQLKSNVRNLKLLFPSQEFCNFFFVWYTVEKGLYLVGLFDFYL